MQELCLSICSEFGVEGTSSETLDVDNFNDDLYFNVAQSTGRAVFEKLKKGPRSRTDRQKRYLKNGTETDIYGVVLAALESIKPGLQTLEYEQIRNATRDVIQSKTPQINEITRVLDHMSRISFDENSSTPVIDWDKEDQQLHITDPFFAFYLRWGRINLEV